MPRIKSARSDTAEKLTRHIQDPFDPDRMIQVEVRQLDPLSRMAARREIDDAQARAGVLFRQSHEVVASTGLRAVDFLHEKVDGGRVRNGLPERSMRAAQRLREAQLLLGWQGYRIVECVLVGGCPAATIAEQTETGVSRETVSWQVRSALEQLAVLWGLAQDPKKVRRRAAIVAAMTERPGWLHEERELAIQYA